MVKCAIVILNWNGKDMLKQFLPEVLKHCNAERDKVWVADNGSTDDSVEWVRHNLPGTGIIEMGENLGFAAGYNRALESVDADYFILLNSDIEVTEGWLDPVINYMEANNEVAACQPKILNYSKRDYFEYAGAAGGYIDRFGFPFCRGRVHNNVERDEGQYNDRTDIFWASGACLIIRSSVWKETGGLDADFFLHMEEIDLCWRILSRGYRIIYIPESVVYHLGGGSLPYDSPSKIYYNFRNNLFMLHKNLPGINYKQLIFKRMVIDGLGALRYLGTLRFRLFIQVLKAHLAYKKNRRLLDEKRSYVQASSTCYPSHLIFDGSMVFRYFLKGKKKFSEIWTA